MATITKRHLSGVEFSANCDAIPMSNSILFIGRHLVAMVVLFEAFLSIP